MRGGTVLLAHVRRAERAFSHLSPQPARLNSGPGRRDAAFGSAGGVGPPGGSSGGGMGFGGGIDIAGLSWEDRERVRQCSCFGSPRSMNRGADHPRGAFKLSVVFTAVA